MTLSASRSRQVVLLALGAALAAGCSMLKSRRPGSDMVIVRRSFDPVAAVVRSQCRQPPAGPGTAVRDSLTRSPDCAVLVGDSVARGSAQPVQPPQRVP